MFFVWYIPFFVDPCQYTAMCWYLKSFYSVTRYNFLSLCVFLKFHSVTKEFSRMRNGNFLKKKVVKKFIPKKLVDNFNFNYPPTKIDANEGSNFDATRTTPTDVKLLCVKLWKRQTNTINFMMSLYLNFILANSHFHIYLKPQNVIKHNSKLSRLLSFFFFFRRRGGVGCIHTRTKYGFEKNNNITHKNGIFILM